MPVICCGLDAIFQQINPSVVFEVLIALIFSCVSGVKIVIAAADMLFSVTTFQLFNPLRA